MNDSKILQESIKLGQNFTQQDILNYLYSFSVGMGIVNNYLLA